MLSLRSLAGRTALLGVLGRAAMAQQCLSFGMDFQNGGSYFQNSLSDDPFTFVSQFDHCQDDVATNILVDPNGDEYVCTDTPLQPDDTDQMSECPLAKNELWSGDWSVIILSNNGNGDPIAYERDFHLDVGPQATTTFTPTVTVPTIITPFVNVTSTTTETDTTTLDPSTVTQPSTTVSPTITSTPDAITSTSWRTLFTLTFTKFTASVTKTTKTETASCIMPTKPHWPDPWARITPTAVDAVSILADTPTPTANSAKFRPRVLDRRVPYDREQRIKERKERIARARGLEVRAPDSRTLTETETDTSLYTTSFETIYDETSTLTVTETTSTTVTETPPPVTVHSGRTVLPPTTITAPTPTSTKTKYTIGTEWTTSTWLATVTLTTTTTPSSVSETCRRHGGFFP